jgi:hypothetical protein
MPFGTTLPSSNVLVVSSDADSWVYRLGIMEIGWLRGKTVYVKRISTSVPKLVNINSFVSAITTHAELGKLVTIHHRPYVYADQRAQIF